MQFCARCGFLAEEEICQFCASARRDQTIICVVAEATDVFAIERTNDYHGLYHVLGGVISPLDGMTPDKLSIPALEERLERVEEVIIALPASTAGESTAIYISRILHEKGVKASRIARGIPMGAQFDYIDEVTMTRALEGRSEI
jgi:recombination protein RecR